MLRGMWEVLRGIRTNKQEEQTKKNANLLGMMTGEARTAAKEQDIIAR